MRFLSYFLLFAVAISAPSVIRAQYDDHVMHVSAVAVPSIITEATPLTIDTNNNNDNNDDQQQQATLAPGTLIAPSLVYNQDHHQEDNDSPIISSLTSPMLIAVDASPSSEEEGLEGQSLLIDYQNDDENTIELFTTINEELQENGAESLLESMDTEDMMIASATAMPIEGDDDDDSSIDAQQYDNNNNNNNDDDDHSSFDIAAAEGEASGDGISKSEAESNLEKEMKSKRRRPLRRAFLRRGVKGMKKAMRRFSPWRMTGRRGLRGKRLEKMLKLAVLSKKLKALDMKMDLMKLLTRAIQMRLLDRSMRGGLGLMRGDRATLMLQSLRNKMMKKLMVLKMIKLMHLLYQSTLGRPVYHRSGMRLSPRFLLRHLLRHAYRHPALAKLLMGLRLKSTIVRSLMKSFVNNLKFLLRKVYLLKKREGGNRHRLYVKADRAIVNVGDGNEFKPVFYRSRAAPRISVDDSAIPVRVTLPSPGIIRRVFERRTGQERRSD